MRNTSWSCSLSLHYSNGFDYSRGDYGLQRKSILHYLRLGVTAGGGGLSLESDYSGCLGSVVTMGSYLVNPEINALPWIKLGVQFLWLTRIGQDLGTSDFGFVMKVDLFEEIDLCDLGSVTPFASARRRALCGYCLFK